MTVDPQNFRLRVLQCLLSLTVILTVASLSISASAFQASTSSVEPRNHTGSPSHELTKESQEAAGDEKGENEEFKQSPSVRLLAGWTGMSLEHAYWLAVLLNFAVIAGVVLWISRSKLPGVFRERTQSIQKAMEEARRTSEEANRRLSDIEARLVRLDSEIGSMRATAEQEAATEEARIHAAAEEDTRKVVETAEQEIAAAAKLARRELKTYAAELAVSLASQQLRINSEIDQALVRNFSAQLGNAAENGSQPGKDGR